MATKAIEQSVGYPINMISSSSCRTCLNMLLLNFKERHLNWHLGASYVAWQGITIDEEDKLVKFDAGRMPLKKSMTLNCFAPFWTSNLFVLNLAGGSICGRLGDLCNSAQNIRTLVLTGTKIRGDIRCFEAFRDLKRLNLERSGKIAGSIESLRNCVHLEVCVLTSTKVSGNIEVFTKMPHISIVALDMTNVFGHVGSFRACRKLHTLKCKFTKVVGDTHSLRISAPLCDARDVLAYEQRLGI